MDSCADILNLYEVVGRFSSDLGNGTPGFIALMHTYSLVANSEVSLRIACPVSVKILSENVDEDPRINMSSFENTSPLPSMKSYRPSPYHHRAVD
jgi:hypothetical protein